MKAKDKKSTTSKLSATSKAQAKPKARAKAPLAKPVFNTRLLKGLVPDATPGKTRKSKVSFIDAMSKMGIKSVFDIIGVPESMFIERLGKVCDADGALAYNNALCFAGQIGSLYREHQVSSGKPQQLSEMTGVRSMVDIGPSYEKLFRENWDKFCKVGALAAMDSPVAYLRSIYRLATQTLEPGGEGTKAKILLDTRRPDLKSLLIDQHSTFTPRPMLELVNDVLKAGIEQYLKGTPDAEKPIYQILAERKHPFIFPYNVAHHQCMLGLGGKKPALGELNYRVSMKLPIHRWSRGDYGAVQNSPTEAQRLLSGLNPEQQKLLIEPSLFTTFYLNKSSLTPYWQGPGTVYLSPHEPHGVGYLVLPGQPAVRSVAEPAQILITATNKTNLATLIFSKQSAPSLDGAFNLRSSTPENAADWSLNHRHSASIYTISPRVNLPSSFPANSDGYRATFNLTLATGAHATPQYLSTLSFTLLLDDSFNLTPQQGDFFLNYFGVPDSEPLVSLKTFLQQTELSAVQVEALLSRRTHYPRLSANCPTFNLQAPKSGTAGLYGSCYVNGHGSDRYDTLQPPTAASIINDKYDNAMDLKEVQESLGPVWYLTKTSLNRLDRLQRMIRLQRWTEISFAELDTVVASVMRSEGVNNLTLDLNVNTLRALGVYRYLSRHYTLMPEEFAGLLHHLPPYATKHAVSLFDQVFNSPVLLDEPLRLDQQEFSATDPDENSRKTLAQLCAALHLQFTPDSLQGLLGNTQKYVGKLTRSLATLSAVYRQARVARLFGVSVAEMTALVRLLGGEDYLRILCRGSLTPVTHKSKSQVTLRAYLPGNMRITLFLFVDPLEAGSLLTLEPGSGIHIISGEDFSAANRTRSFTITRLASDPSDLNFLRNPDGTTLTLDPLSADENAVILSGYKVSKTVWETLARNPQTVISIDVKCGNFPTRSLTILTSELEHKDTPHPDVLDVLMQLDWLWIWLKESKQSRVDVLYLLGEGPGDYLPPEGLVDRISGLGEATRQVLVTDAQIRDLHLPTHETPKKRKAALGARAPIDWRKVLLPLLDNQGLVKSLALEVTENTLAQLQAHLTVALNSLELVPTVREECVEKLSNLLLSGHDRQLRLIEGLAQGEINLPMDRAQVVVRWAQTSVYDLLSAVLNLNLKAPLQAGGVESLLIKLRRVLRYGMAAMHLRLSTAALRVFLVHPYWLMDAPSGSLQLDLASFYFLHSYSQWFSSERHEEEVLLGYLMFSNPLKAKLRTKAMRSAVNEEAALALASLLNWNKDEIATLVKLLPHGRACSVADVDWVRRCQATCVMSGLSVAGLLNATALEANSTRGHWQAVGEAALAASR